MDIVRLERLVAEACDGLEGVDETVILENLQSNLFDGMEESTVAEALSTSARTLIEREPDYGRAAARLLLFDLEQLGKALKPERDLSFTYLGLQTLYDRYFFLSDGIRFELPQAFFMRVAMGLAMDGIDREKRAIEFYELLSSCYLTTVLDGIYGAIKDNALLSKFAGGLGND